ncbi:MAG: peptidylprolyl isomerase [candidate division Zixibacteria bacterium]|nr:peptidylprolyl isomerase [candidate division Zixibacteria bacterium]
MKKLALGMLIIVLLAGCSSDEKKPVYDDTVIMKAGRIEFTLSDMEFHMSRFNYRDPADEMYKRQDFLEQHLDKLIICDAGLGFNLLDSVEVDSGQVVRILSELIYKREVNDKLNITDKDVRKFWEKYGGEVNVSHILVKSKQLADSLYQVLKKSPEKFSELAVQFSEDKSTNYKYGSIGYIRVGTMVDEFQDVAFSLKPDEISKPVYSSFGWHIIKMHDRAMFTDADFEEEKGNYRGKYSISQRKKLQNEYVKRTQAKLGYKFHEKTWEMLVEKAMANKEADPDKTRRLSQYIATSDLSEEEAVMPIVTINDKYNYSADEFISNINKIFRKDGVNFEKKDLTLDALDEFTASRLMYVDALNSNLIDSPEFKRQVLDTKYGYIYRKMLDDYIFDTISVTEDDMKAYYEKNKKMFVDPVQIRAAEILVHSQEEAEEILAQLKNGADWSKLVKRTIRPGFAATEGNLGFFGPKKHSYIYKTAVELDVGEYGGPVPVQDNWAVFKITGKKPESVQSYSEVKPRIEARMLGERKYGVLQKWVDNRKQYVEHFLDLELLKNNLVSGKLEDEI